MTIEDADLLMTNPAELDETLMDSHHRLKLHLVKERQRVASGARTDMDRLLSGERIQDL